MIDPNDSEAFASVVTCIEKVATPDAKRREARDAANERARNLRDDLERREAEIAALRERLDAETQALGAARVAAAEHQRERDALEARVTADEALWREWAGRIHNARTSVRAGEPELQVLRRLAPGLFQDA